MRYLHTHPSLREGGREFFLFCLADELPNRVSAELRSSENHGGTSSCCLLQRSGEPVTAEKSEPNIERHPNV